MCAENIITKKGQSNFIWCCFQEDYSKRYLNTGDTLDSAWSNKES